jgi:CRP-like cAMP-binding protein
MKSHYVSCQDCERRDQSIFCSVEEDGLQAITDHKVMNIYKKGQVLFHQGNPSFGAYCVNEGKVKLTKVDGQGREMILQIVGPGEVIEQGQDKCRSLNQVSAIALEESKICFLDKHFFKDFLQNHPEVDREVIAHMAQYIMELQERLLLSQHRSVMQKMCFFLIELSERFSVKRFNGDLALDIILSREEMGAYIGVATETVIRTMSELKDLGVIAQEGKRLILTDIDKIKNLAKE